MNLTSKMSTKENQQQRCWIDFLILLAKNVFLVSEPISSFGVELHNIPPKSTILLSFIYAPISIFKVLSFQRKTIRG